MRVSVGRPMMAPEKPAPQDQDTRSEPPKKTVGTVVPADTVEPKRVSAAAPVS